MNTDTRNPLRQQLEIAETLIEPSIVPGHCGPAQWSAAELCEKHGVSVATLKRHIADLRTMGCRIEAFGGGKNPWFYRLLNADQVTNTIRRWLELERCRDLTLYDMVTGRGIY